MSYHAILRAGLLISSCLIAGLVQAADMLVLGLFKDMAILRVDGVQYKLRIGETSPQGIKLIKADSEQAVLEINGQQVVGVSVTDNHYASAIDYCCVVKNRWPEILTVMGGPQVNALKGVILNNERVDYAFQGECECSFPLFLDLV